jgi:competence ComEA-like helix-hairpin-helix protein
MRNRSLRLVAALAIVAAWLVLPAPALAAKAKKLDLNTASQKELEELPGVGEATANKIIAGRPYSSVADLEKAGVPKSTIDKISSQVTVSKSKAKDTKSETTAKTEKSEAKPASEKTSTSKSEAKPAASSGAKVDLNNASQKELEELPGVGSATAKKIIAGRPYASVDDLAKAGVGKSTIEKIRPQVTLGAAPAPAAKAAASSEKPASSKSSEAASSSKSSAPASSAKSSEASTPKQPPPAKGMVWVNTATKVYHYEGDRWYGNTKEGKYMTEDDAIKAGYRASKEGQKKQ